MRVGLVLGGGGVVGLAYHAAALAAMENDLRWSPAAADVVVGTSAGSLAAALLRLGVTPLDLAGVAVGADVGTMPAPILDALRTEAPLPPFSVAALLRPPRVPDARILTSWLRRPWRLDPLGAVVSVLPDGELDLAQHARSFGAAVGSAWPADDLWICAVRQRDLRRKMFGRDVVAPLSDAVMASCAIPGYFKPVRVGGDAFVDGGVSSPTNADVLRHCDLDLAIVVSPMSGRDRGGHGPQQLMRRYAGRKLDREVATLRRAGIPTVVVEPGLEVVAALGSDFMSHERLAEITHLAFMDTGEQLRAPAVRTLLAGLHAQPPTHAEHVGAMPS